MMVYSSSLIATAILATALLTAGTGISPAAAEPEVIRLFIAQDGDTVMRVSFADYSFFVPTDISGRRVVMIGELVAREQTPEQAGHNAKDPGASDDTLRPGKVWELVATSVRIPRG